MQVPILTISEFTQRIKSDLEKKYPAVFLQGEISNGKRHTSGHYYFSLKDEGAQISAVMFRMAVGGLKFQPKDGDKVVVRAELTVYPPQGRYQLIVQEMRQAGLGELLQKLEERKEMLRKKGWFDEKHKKPIPKLPKRIGIVTSPTGAAIHDMLHILKRRFSGFHVILNPVRVQGEGAALEIAQAIQQFNTYDLVDVMIVGRGGGSIEDLWAFNELEVAEAIFNSRIPVISAVGHETDTTIADFVADIRAPTPSAAAELVIAEREGQLKTLSHMEHRLEQYVRSCLALRKTCLFSLMRQRFLTTPYALIGPLAQKLDHLHKRLEALKPAAQIHYFKEKVQQLASQIGYAWEMRERERKRLLQEKFPIKRFNTLILRQIQTTGAHYKKLVAALQGLDPKNVLKKGYAIPFSQKDGSVITSVKNVSEHEAIKWLLSDGELFTTVTDKKVYERKERSPI